MTGGRPKAVLFATVGRTDLKLLVAGSDGRPTLAELRPQIVRAVHEAILDGGLPTSVRSDPSAVRRPGTGGRGVEVDFDPAAREFSERNGMMPVMEAGAHVLVPVKLQAVAEKLTEQFEPIAVLIFTTNRDRAAPRIRNGEPVAAGPLLSRWLAERFGLRAAGREGEFGAGIAGWVDFLVGNSTLEGVLPEDQPVDRRHVDQLDRAIVSLQGCLAGLETVACVSAGGGMAEIKEPLRAIVRMRFGSAHTRDWHDTQERTEVSASVAPWIQPGPAATDSFRHRELALRRIEQGDLVGAHAVARHLAAYHGDAKWVEKLRLAAEYITGALPADAFGGTSPPPAWLAPLLSPNRPRVLRAAIAVECALRAGRLVDAAVMTCGIVDVAQFDLAGRLPDCTINEDRLVFGSCPPSWLSPFLSRSGVGYRMVRPRPSSRSTSRLSALLKDHGVDPDGSLARFDTALEHAERGSLSPRALRNSFVHGLPQRKAIEALSASFAAAGVWAAPLSDGFRCLRQERMQSLLSALDVPDADVLCDGLIDGPRDELLRHRSVSG